MPRKPIVMSKETPKGKINIYSKLANKHTILSVGYDGEKAQQRRISLCQTEFGSDHGFVFDGTEWFLGYDFNLKLDHDGSLQSSLAAEENGMYPVFVYGTLRFGMWNHYILDGHFEKAEKAITQGSMYHNGSYPYLYEGDNVARGEVYYLHENLYKRIMRQLDGIEGFYEKGYKHNHYNRELVDVILANGETIKAWCYFGNEGRGYNSRERLTMIKDGDFVRWSNEYGRGRR